MFESANFVAAAVESAAFVQVDFAQVAVVEPRQAELFFLHSGSERKLCRLPI